MDLNVEEVPFSLYIYPSTRICQCRPPLGLTSESWTLDGDTREYLLGRGVPVVDFLKVLIGHRAFWKSSFKRF